MDTNNEGNKSPNGPESEAQNGAGEVKNEVGSEAFRISGLPKTTCSICNTNKVRLKKNTPKKSSRQYYENEIGQAWSGLKCPTCFQGIAREHMRKKRNKITVPIE